MLANILAAHEEGADSALPEFANAENQRLSEQIRRREADLAQVETKLSEHMSRVSVLKAHVRHVHLEVQNTQLLVVRSPFPLRIAQQGAKDREVESERHMLQLCEREAGRYSSEAEQLDKERRELEDRLNTAQNEKFKAEERLDKAKVDMDWGADEAQQWEAAASQKVEDGAVLSRYAVLDERKARELSLEVERLTVERTRRKDKLDAEVTEARALQIQLDKAAMELRSVQAERTELVAQWEDAIEALQQRDESISAMARQLEVLKEDVQGQKARVSSQNSVLEEVKDTVAQTERQMNNADRLIGTLRSELAKKSAGMQDSSDEVGAMVNAVLRVTSEVTRKRNDIKVAREAIDERQRRIERERTLLASARERLAKQVDVTSDKVSAARGVEEMLKIEEHRVKQIERELSDMKTEMFRRGQELHSLHATEANLVAEIGGAEAALKNLNSNIHRLDAEALKQQELVYNQEFQLQQLERKVSRASGDRSDEEKKALNAKIKSLQAELDECVAELHLLQAQQRKIAENVRSKRRRIESARDDRVAAESQIESLELSNSQAERELKAATKQQEEVMVQQTVQRLEVKRLNDLLHVRADEVYGLENRKAQMELSLQERETEISAHHDTLKASLRSIDEERHRAAVELKVRTTRVDKLQKKYDTLMHRLNAGEESTQAAYVIKAAQDREVLQATGDQLDAAIKQGSKEVAALENTLRVINLRNEELRLSFQKADPKGLDMQLKQDVDSRYRNAMDSFKYKRRELREQEEDLHAMEHQLQVLSKERGSLTEHIHQMDLDATTLNGEIADANRRAQVAIAQADRLAQKLGTDSSVLSDTSSAALKVLGAVAGSLGQAGVMERSCVELGLDVPDRAKTPGKSRPTSTAGSVRTPSRPTSSVRTPSRSSVRTPSRSSVRTPKSTGRSTITDGLVVSGRLIE